MMSNQLTIVKAILIIILLQLLPGCKQKNEKKNIASGWDKVMIDSLDPAKTHGVVKLYDGVVIDSIYMNLLGRLHENNQYELLFRHLEFYEQLKGDDNKAFIDVAYGDYYCYTARYDSAILCYKAALQSSDTSHPTTDVGNAYCGLATSYLYKGDFDKVYQYGYKALRAFEKIGDSSQVYSVLSDQAAYYYYTGDYQTGLNKAYNCREYYIKHQDSSRIAYTEGIISSFYYALKDYKKGEQFALSSLSTRRNLGNLRDIGESLNSLSLVYISQEKWDEALAALNETLDLVRRVNDRRQVPVISYNMAYCYLYKGLNAKAEQLFQETIDSAGAYGQRDILAQAYEGMYKLNKKKGNDAQALQYLEIYRSSNDSMMGIQKANDINKQNEKYASIEKEARIKTLISKNKVITLRQQLFMAISISLILIGALSIRLLINKNKKNKLIVEKMDLELRHNEENLKIYTESLKQKNMLIDEMEKKMFHLTSTKANEDKVIDEEKMSELYQFKILTDDDWGQFKVLFDKVYPGFINKLRILFPDLSQSEERQSLLIILNLKSKECADMLGISVDSIKKNRYRLKKKFALADEDNLDDFVKRLV